MKRKTKWNKKGNIPCSHTRVKGDIKEKEWQERCDDLFIMETSQVINSMIAHLSGKDLLSPHAINTILRRQMMRMEKV